MCDMPDCDNDEIYVAIYWKEEDESPQTNWAYLCKKCFNKVKDKNDGSAIFK